MLLIRQQISASPVSAIVHCINWWSDPIYKLHRDWRLDESLCPPL